MTKVSCNGLGSGSPPYSKEVPTVQIYPHMTIEGVEVTISLEAYTRLVNWASMGRTLDGILEALSECGAEWEVISELNDVRAALDECHQAVRRHWAKV
jgi:hypothetical protein